MVYNINCSYDDNSSIEVSVNSDESEIKCVNSPNWSNFHYTWPLIHVNTIYYQNCSAQSKLEDSLRFANMFDTQEILRIIFKNLSGSLYSHNFEAYPRLTVLEILNSDIRNASFDFLKGNEYLFNIKFRNI